jgi:DNA ligase-1
LSSFSDRVLTGNAAQDTIQDFIDSCDPDWWNDFYRLILLKDIKAGVSAKTINKVLEGTVFEDLKIPERGCMLAEKADDNPNYMKGVKWLEPKLDGVRIYTVCDPKGNKATMHTRNGHQNFNFPHVTKWLEQNFVPYLDDVFILDGEIMSKDFQALMRQFHRKNDVETSDSVYWLFDGLPADCFGTDTPSTILSERKATLVEMFRDVGDKDPVQVIDHTEADLDSVEGQNVYKAFLKRMAVEGFEGAMVKDPQSVYECKRAKHWLKKKPVVEVTLTVVGVEPGAQGTKYENILGYLVCEGEDEGKNIRVRVGSGFTDELRQQIWDEQEHVIGQMVEVQCDTITKNQDSEDVYSLRFPVFKCFRGFEPGEKI